MVIFMEKQQQGKNANGGKLSLGKFLLYLPYACTSLSYAGLIRMGLRRFVLLAPRLASCKFHLVYLDRYQRSEVMFYLLACL